MFISNKLFELTLHLIVQLHINLHGKPCVFIFVFLSVFFWCFMKKNLKNLKINNVIIWISKGNPHVHPSVIVAKIMERFQLSDEKNSRIFDLFNDGRPMSAPPTPGPNSDLTDIRHPEP